jgi:single-strand DNA-binding protein
MLKLMTIGNIGQNAKIQKVNGKTAINFSVAHNKKVKLADGTEKEITVWINCTKWLKPGKTSKLSNYLKKGTRVFLSGEPSVRAYTTGAGQPAASMDLNVHELELLSVPDGDAENQQTNSNPAPASAPAPAPAPENNHHGIRNGNDDLPF